MVSIRMCVLALTVEGEKSNNVELLVREGSVLSKMKHVGLVTTEAVKGLYREGFARNIHFPPYAHCILISLVVGACIVKDLFEIFTFLPVLTLSLISLILEYA